MQVQVCHGKHILLRSSTASGSFQPFIINDPHALDEISVMSILDLQRGIPWGF